MCLRERVSLLRRRDLCRVWRRRAGAEQPHTGEDSQIDGGCGECKEVSKCYFNISLIFVLHVFAIMKFFNVNCQVLVCNKPNFTNLTYVVLDFVMNSFHMSVQGFSKIESFVAYHAL